MLRGDPRRRVLGSGLLRAAPLPMTRGVCPPRMESGCRVSLSEEIEHLAVNPELPWRAVLGEPDGHRFSRINRHKNQVAMPRSGPYKIRLILSHVAVAFYKYDTLSAVNCAIRTNRFRIVFIRIYLERSSKFLDTPDIADRKLIVLAVDGAAKPPCHQYRSKAIQALSGSSSVCRTCERQ